MTHTYFFQTHTLVESNCQTLDAWELAVRKVYEQHVLRLQKQAERAKHSIGGYCPSLPRIDKIVIHEAMRCTPLKELDGNCLLQFCFKQTFLHAVNMNFWAWHLADAHCGYQSCGDGFECVWSLWMLLVFQNNVQPQTVSDGWPRGRTSTTRSSGRKRQGKQS